MILIVLLGGCGAGGVTATPTPAITPTPVPRPTAETPAAVAGWSLAALDEGEVQVRADLTAFEIEELTRIYARHYPKLAIHWTRGSDDDLLATTLREAGNAAPAWDVYIGHSAPTLKTARLVDRWTPPEARGLPIEVLDPEGAWYAVAMTYHVLQYNTEQVIPSSRPMAYEQLRHPDYFGRLSVPSEDLTWLRGLVESRGRDATVELLRPLAEQGTLQRGDPRVLSAFVTSGQQAIGIDSVLDVVERDRRGGGKTGWVAIEPVVVQPLGMALAARSPHPNAARVFANFMLSPDAQSVLALAGRVPSRPDIDPEPQAMVRGIKTQVTLPPQGAMERDLRALWNDIWSVR